MKNINERFYYSEIREIQNFTYSQQYRLGLIVLKASAAVDPIVMY